MFIHDAFMNGFIVGLLVGVAVMSFISLLTRPKQKKTEDYIKWLKQSQDISDYITGRKRF